jgi:hypothetical protein
MVRSVCFCETCQIFLPSLDLYVNVESSGYVTTVVMNGWGIDGPSTGDSSCSSDMDFLLCMSL